MFCCALVSGYCMTSYGVPMAFAMVLCVLIGLAFGTFNGWMVSYMSVPPFIISMASMNIAKGIASVFTKTQSVSWPQSSDPVNGLVQKHRIRKRIPGRPDHFPCCCGYLRNRALQHEAGTLYPVPRIQQ